MVGIKKTYFDSAGDDDWKYKIRCCKVCSYFCTFLVSRGPPKEQKHFEQKCQDFNHFLFQLLQLDTYTLSEKPNSCKWGDWTSDDDPSDNYVSGKDYNHDELSPPYWDENVYMTGMMTKYKEWGTTQ